MVTNVSAKVPQPVDMPKMKMVVESMAACSFGSMMNQSMNNSVVSVGNTEKASAPQPATKDNAKSAYDNAVKKPDGQDMKAYGDNTDNKTQSLDREKSVTGDIAKENDSISDENAKDVIDEIKETVKNMLELTDEELEQMLAQAGMVITDLLSSQNLASFVAQVMTDGEAVSLITDDKAFDTFTKLNATLGNIVAENAQALNVNEDELLDAITKLPAEGTEPENTDEMPKELPQELTQKLPQELAQGVSLNEAMTDVRNDIPVQTGVSEDDVKDMTGVMNNVTDNADDTSIDSTVKPLEIKEATVARRTQDDKQTADNTQDTQQTEADKTLSTPQIKVTVQQDKESGRQNTDKGNSGHTGNFVETLVQNVDRQFNADSVFEGYQVNVRDVIRQIVDAVRVGISQNSTSIELQLSPENLGKVNVTVAAKDGIITAQITAQTEAAKTVIENQLVMLKENFNAQGLKVEAVEVTLASHGFETGRNFEGSENGQAMQEEEHKNTRILTLDEIDALLADDDAPEDEQLAAKMMQATGGNVDYMA